MREKRVSWPWALAVAALVAACGGGGGGGGNEPSNGADQPTFRFTPSTVQYQQLVELIMSTGGTLRWAQFATDVVHRFASPGSPASVTANCAYTGRITLTFDDRDGNGRASPGDSIGVTMTNCVVPILGATTTGSLRVDVTAGASDNLLAEVQSRLTITDTLRLGSYSPNNPGASVPLGTVQGSLLTRWSGHPLGEDLQARSTAEDDLRLTVVSWGEEVAARLQKLTVSRSERFDEATVTGSMNFALDLPDRGGRLNVRTSTPLRSDLNAVSRTGVIEADLAGNELMRLRPILAGGVIPSIEYVHTLSSGRIQADGHAAWSGDFGMLTYDVRALTGVGLGMSVANYSDRGGGYGVVVPWLGVSPRSEIDRACAQNTGAGVFPYTRADALFQRPVVPATAATSEGAVYRVQFGRALADSTPAVQFRFRDAEFPADPELPVWNVPASTVRQGALFEVRPVEALRHGRSYVLESSLDGVTWTGPRVFLDPTGAVVNQGQESFWTIDTDDMLTLGLAPGERTVPAPALPVRLVPVVAARDGQGIARYRWEQLSGSPVTFSAQDAAVTEVSYAAGPRTVAEVQVQLTVTDTRGDSERLRVALKVGDEFAAGALSYRRLADTPVYRKVSLEVGAGSVRYDAASGEARLRTPPDGQLPLFYNLGLRMPDAGPLQLGTYDNALPTPSPPGRAGITQMIPCTDPAAWSGRFDVLELELDPDGNVTRLAVDYQQRCNLPGGESVVGSFRFHSTRPYPP